MRTTLGVSILLNCSLLACLALLLLSRSRAQNPVAARTEAASVPQVSETVTPTAEVKPIRWSQIEAADYPTYIANLRAIGCPEHTIRDIITADVDSQYVAQRRPLEAKLAASAAAGRFGTEAELRALRDQEASAIAALLGTAPAAAETASAQAEISASSSVRQTPSDAAVTSQALQSSSPSGREPSVLGPCVMLGFPPSGSAGQKPSAPVSLPLVFHELDPSVLTLSSQQQQVVNDLRQKFIQEVGGPNQDPNDPAYAQRWQESEPEADFDLWTMLGINAFQAHQIAAWDQAHAQQSTAP
jgi:hypothetical protein